MDSSTLRRGYVKITTTKGLGNSLTRLTAKKHWVVLCAEPKGRIEIYKGEDDAATRKNPLKIIATDQILNISSSSDRKEMSLTLHGNEMITFTYPSRADHDDWLRDIQSTRGKHAGAKSRPHTIAAPPEEDRFRVVLRQSPSLLFHGPCMLEIQRDFERNLFHIALFCDEIPPRLIVKWQIDHIRQYGSNDIAFKFQSGSKSPTNVDWFILDTEHGDAPKIHRSVDYWAHHIVEQAKNMMMPPAIRSGSISTVQPTSPIGGSIHGLSSSVPATLSPSFDHMTNSLPPHNNSTYMPLVPSTRQPAPIYDGVDNRSNPPPHNTVGFASNASSSSNGVYQSLTTSSVASSTYAGLDEVTRDRNPNRVSSSFTSPPPDQSHYMGLMRSSSDNQHSTYMDITPKKT